MFLIVWSCHKLRNTDLCSVCKHLCRGDEKELAVSLNFQKHYWTSTSHFTVLSQVHCSRRTFIQLKGFFDCFGGGGVKMKFLVQ